MKTILFAATAALFAAGAAYAQPADAPPGGGPSPEMRALFQAARDACASDIKSLCGDKQERREQMMCLRQNIDKASQPCKDAMSKLPQRRPQ